MTTTKHHSRSHEPRCGLLARVIDRVRVWLGERAIASLRHEAGRMRKTVREQARAVGEQARAVLGARRASRTNPRRDDPRRFASEGHRHGYVPTPQPWPWRFMSHGVPWAPGPESHGPPFWSFHPGPPHPLARGRFSGRGPRNYRRSDERIIDDIHEVLTYSSQIDASDIEVRVDQGEVTVLGTVDDRYTRRLVEDLIHDVPGVRDLHNRLRVAARERAGATGIGRAHSGIEPLRIRRDITAGRDLDDAESANSHLNTGDDRCLDERGTSSTSS